ncbi:hypothetical protein C8Q77DRAFT_1161799 [Trametes polyzona]|nr:hypothetical protein C8Q77DRAFT_1161799 [Trametes polyzona]
MQSVVGSSTGSNSKFTQESVSDLHGRTALVTGGTQGIGYEVSRALALAGARVLLLSRKVDNGEKAVAAIKSQSPAADVEFIECDLGDLTNVKAVADHICADESRLDIVVADAGVSTAISESTTSFFLINRLLPLLRHTASIPGAPAPRIVSVSSELHRMAPSSVAFSSPAEVSEDVNIGPTGYYARSKLANILFTKYGLVERVFFPNDDRIYALVVHPGAVRTGQQEQMKEAYGALLGNIIKSLTVPFMRTPEEGSLSTLWAATSEDVERKGLNGRYFTEAGQVSEESSQAQDAELGKNLWVLSENLVRQKLGPDALLPWNVAAKA